MCVCECAPCTYVWLPVFRSLLLDVVGMLRVLSQTLCRVMIIMFACFCAMLYFFFLKSLWCNALPPLSDNNYQPISALASSLIFHSFWPCFFEGVSLRQILQPGCMLYVWVKGLGNLPSQRLASPNARRSGGCGYLLYTYFNLLRRLKINLNLFQITLQCCCQLSFVFRHSGGKGGFFLHFTRLPLFFL